MQQDAFNGTGAASLFRSRAAIFSSRRLFGSVTLIVPPSGTLALAVAVLALTLLGVAAWTIEIPQRATAVGILMPPEGVIDVVASAPGRVTSIDVAEGQSVASGDVLLEIASDSDELAGKRLQILRAESSLLDRAREGQLAIDRKRLSSLDERLASIDERLRLAREQHRHQQQQLRLAERRLKRRHDLAGSGSLPDDAVDQERSEVIGARIRLAAMRRTILDVEQERAAVIGERATVTEEADHRAVLHDLDKRRLEREIVEHEYLTGRQVRAPDTGVVARVNVRPGATVRPGEVLLKVYRPYRALEAWLYLPSARTGFLEEGQRVKLRFDAYPHQLFGTTDAIVTAVSRVAVVPWELRVPLTLEGPVFEIRASLERTSIEAFESIWAMKPGTSFKADIEQRRYKLFEWLLRGLAGGGDGRHG